MHNQELNISFIYAAEKFMDFCNQKSFPIKKVDNDRYLFDKSFFEFNYLLHALNEIGLLKKIGKEHYQIEIEDKLKTLSNKQVLVLLYVLKYQPSWSYRFKQGIDKLNELKDTDINIFQCLNEVGIFEDPISKNTLEMIKIVRDRIYSDNNKIERCSDTGLIGENLSKQYEKIITGEEPRHISFYDNFAGFDLLSNIVGKFKRIEVKTSKYMKGFISFNEWSKAIESNKYDIRYEFHLWDIRKQDRPRLAILDINDLSFIPIEIKSGHHFETYSINFNAFEDKFIDFYEISNLEKIEIKEANHQN